VRLLVTRPEPDGERTAAKLRARGHEVMLAPLLRVEILPDADLGDGPWGALALTSANAVRAVAQHRRRAELLRLPVFAVGARTAAAARAAGFSDVHSADGNESDLVRLIAVRQLGSAPLLYLAGEDRASDLSLSTVRTVVVYRAVAAATLPPPVRDALAAGGLDGVLHFSRRSTGIYLSAARAAGILDRALAATHYCLSPQVAEPLQAAGAATIHVAPRPEEDALIGLVPPQG
jgi:uroporphyrinogen-III synthase